MNQGILPNFQSGRALVIEHKIYILNPQYFTKKRIPELLIFAFFAAALKCPILDKLTGRLLLRHLQISFPIADIIQ
jgi:hypothetical protein